MIKSYRCPNGSSDCSFDEEDEQALVAKVMRTIERHNKKKDNSPCPLCLRDTMLAAAALLHLEAARIGLKASKKQRAGGKRHREAFAQAARDRLEAVIDANAAIASRNAH